MWSGERLLLSEQGAGSLRADGAVKGGDKPNPKGTVKK